MTANLRISVGQYSDKGRKDENQDFLAYRVPADSLLAIKGAAFAMADGISSSRVSRSASETSVKSFLEDYFCTSDTWPVKVAAKRVLAATNSWLHAQNMQAEHRFDKDRGYVCTFSALILKNQSAHIFHLGDTRVYHLTKHGLTQLTHDHRVWESPEKSYLSRALGADDLCKIDYQSVEIARGDIFILATDGIYEFLENQALVTLIEKENTDLDRAAKRIATEALAAGSADNLSVQIVRVDEVPKQGSLDILRSIDELPFPPGLTSRTSFDGYLILRELHSGSRSHVFLAEDQSTKKQVVLKVPSTDLGNDSDALERFVMEEWIARRINSTYVLKADLPDRKRNYLYTVFEYIEGRTLAQWAIDNPESTVERVREIIEQIARGLHAFHRLEMLHQDLRPENIIIDSRGTVKIIDFGSVYVAGLEEGFNVGRSSYLLGTALYSAPEYFLGAPGSVKSDLFSLGVLGYFLLSGQYPYATDVPKAKTLNAQKNLRYRSVLNEDREVPAWIDHALRKALHPLPQRRYDELFEFIHDLRKPSRDFYSKTKAPLIERNPLLFWQGLSLVLALTVIALVIVNYR